MNAKIGQSWRSLQQVGSFSASPAELPLSPFLWVPPYSKLSPSCAKSWRLMVSLVEVVAKPGALTGAYAAGVGSKLGRSGAGNQMNRRPILR